MLKNKLVRLWVEMFVASFTILFLSWHLPCGKEYNQENFMQKPTVNAKAMNQLLGH